MSNTAARSKKRITIGLDLGDRRHTFCVLDETGKVAREGTLGNTREELATMARSYPGATAVMEAGMHSPWVSCFLQELGLRVIVANPRKTRAIYQNERKSDRRDAMMLARLARMDATLLHPVKHGGQQAQQDMLQLKLRDSLVRTRVALINAMRFSLKSLGYSVSNPSSESFHKFVLKVGSPERFGRTRDIGAFLGLCPKRDQSGETDKELRISKCGDRYLRRLLVGAAQYILGPFGADSALREHGLRLAQEGTAKAKKRAVVAVARKLAVLLLTLWKSREPYESFPTMA